MRCAWSPYPRPFCSIWNPQSVPDLPRWNYGGEAASVPTRLATTTKGSALLRSLLPSVPFALAGTAGPVVAPPEPVAASPAEAAPLLPYGPVAPPRVDIRPLPSREIAVTVENINTNETAIFFIGPDGRTRVDQAAAIEQFFRCRRTGRHKPLADGVLALLVNIARRWPGKVIEVVSGYRSPPYGTVHSRHFFGNAIDLRVRGVRTSKVRDHVWREHHEVGVGHYHAQDFLHVDSRPGQLDTAWSAASENSRLKYDPRWAKRARRAPRSIPGAMASLSSTAR